MATPQRKATLLLVSSHQLPIAPQLEVGPFSRAPLLLLNMPIVSTLVFIHLKHFNQSECFPDLDCDPG